MIRNLILVTPTLLGLLLLIVGYFFGAPIAADVFLGVLAFTLLVALGFFLRRLYDERDY